MAMHNPHDNFLIDSLSKTIVFVSERDLATPKKLLMFYCCLYNYPLNKADVASRTDILKLCISDEDPADDAG